MARERDSLFPPEPPTPEGIRAILEEDSRAFQQMVLQAMSSGGDDRLQALHHQMVEVMSGELQARLSPDSLPETRQAIMTAYSNDRRRRAVLGGLYTASPANFDEHAGIITRDKLISAYRELYGKVPDNKQALLQVPLLADLYPGFLAQCHRLSILKQGYFNQIGVVPDSAFNIISVLATNRGLETYMGRLV